MRHSVTVHCGTAAKCGTRQPFSAPTLGSATGTFQHLVLQLTSPNKTFKQSRRQNDWVEKRRVPEDQALDSTCHTTRAGRHGVCEVQRYLLQEGWFGTDRAQRRMTRGKSFRRTACDWHLHVHFFCWTESFPLVLCSSGTHLLHLPAMHLLVGGLIAASEARSTPAHASMAVVCLCVLWLERGGRGGHRHRVHRPSPQLPHKPR